MQGTLSSRTHNEYEDVHTSTYYNTCTDEDVLVVHVHMKVCIQYTVTGIDIHM